MYAFFRCLNRRYFLSVVLLVLLVEASFPVTFRWVDSKGEKDDKEGIFLELSGDIKVGDYERFRVFVRDNLSKWKNHRNVRLSSNGGNLVEALQISNLLRAMYPTIYVEERCASACFFLYLSGSSRYGSANLIGIHRAYFEPAYFGGLAPNEAKKKQTQLTSLVNSILDENGVSQTLKDKMQQTSSTTIHWLSSEEIESLGRHPAWYEELLIAKCKYRNVMKAEDAFFTKQPNEKASEKAVDDFLQQSSELRACEGSLFIQESAALNRLLSDPKKSH